MIYLLSVLDYAFSKCQDIWWTTGALVKSYGLFREHEMRIYGIYTTSSFSDYLINRGALLPKMYLPTICPRSSDPFYVVNHYMKSLLLGHIVFSAAVDPHPQSQLCQECRNYNFRLKFIKIFDTA